MEEKEECWGYHIPSYRRCHSQETAMTHAQPLQTQGRERGQLGHLDHMAPLATEGCSPEYNVR